MTVATYRPGDVVRFISKSGVGTGVIDRIGQVNYKIRSDSGQMWNYRMSGSARLERLTGPEAEQIRAKCNGFDALAAQTRRQSASSLDSIPLPDLGSKVRCTPDGRPVLEGIVLKHNRKTFQILNQGDGRRWNVYRGCEWQYV